jgi:hypothetical protein
MANSSSPPLASNEVLKELLERSTELGIGWKLNEEKDILHRPIVTARTANL